MAVSEPAAAEPPSSTTPVVRMSQPPPRPPPPGPMEDASTAGAPSPSTPSRVTTPQSSKGPDLARPLPWEPAVAAAATSGVPRRPLMPPADAEGAATVVSQAATVSLASP
ncbi:arabinogalactan protein 1-like [Miscanthus floridulus]|uniref:arabinogalactan protein 1-like n=1 Tax=Miscanthus floridulus TaxID=154761 RepID=UPI0034589245